MTNSPMVQLMRTLENIVATERAMREQAEQTERKFLQLIIDVANHFASRQIDECRARDPQAPYNWSLKQWEAFFNQNVFEVRSGWGQNQTSATLSYEEIAERHQLEAEHRRLDVERNRLLDMNKRMQQTIDEMERQKKEKGQQKPRRN